MSCLLPGVALAAASLHFTVTSPNADVNKNVQTRLEIESKTLGGNPSPADIKEFYIHSTGIVKDAVSPYGYFNPDVTSSLTQQGGQWSAAYRINLGRPVIIKEVDLQLTGPGNRNPALQGYIHHFPVQVNAIFTADTYNQAKDHWLEIANNQGFIKAEYTSSRVAVNTKTLTARVTLHLTTNERYYFGHLLFNDTPYSDEFLQRFDVFKRNAPFSSNRLIHYQQRMNESPFFNQVIVIPDFQHETADRHIPVHVSVSTPKSHVYTAGVGYGTFTGPRMTAGVKFRRLTDTGQSLDAQVKLSSVLSGLAFKYSIPGRQPLNETWLIGANYQAFKPKTGQSNSRSIMGGYQYKSERWERLINLNYLLERYSLNTNNLPATNSETLYPSLNINYVKADNPISPEFGKSLNLNLQGASENILSSNSFLQGEIKGKYFTTPFSFAHLILRGDIGYTVVHDLNDMPFSLRYFAGGINSIRGFPDSSIGPGKYLGIASAEYRNHIVGDLDAAVFYDIGNATNHIGDPFNRGAGVGAVYESMVGPVKIYFARAISKKGHPYQIEFSLGPEF